MVTLGKVCVAPAVPSTVSTSLAIPDPVVATPVQLPDGQSGRRASDSPQAWRDLSKFPEHLEKKLGLPRLELPLLPRLTLCLQMTFHSAPAHPPTPASPANAHSFPF